MVRMHLPKLLVSLGHSLNAVVLGRAEANRRVSVILRGHGLSL